MNLFFRVKKPVRTFSPVTVNAKLLARTGGRFDSGQIIEMRTTPSLMSYDHRNMNAFEVIFDGKTLYVLAREIKVEKLKKGQLTLVK